MKRNTKIFGKRGGWALPSFLALLVIMAPVVARAHKVTVFAWVEGDTVFTQSKFSGGRYAKGARIEVYTDNGQKLIEGLTDDQGQLAFKPPRPDALRIVLLAGSGHRNEWQVAAEEFTDAGVAAEPPQPADQTASTPSGTRPVADQPATTVTLSTMELQVLIEKAMDRKLAPIRRRLEQQGQSPSLNDIIGGFGYILGLVGLGAYIHSRRKAA